MSKYFNNLCKEYADLCTYGVISYNTVHFLSITKMNTGKLLVTINKLLQ